MRRNKVIEALNLKPAGISVGQNKVYCKLANGQIRDLAQDTINPARLKYLRTLTATVTDKYAPDTPLCDGVTDLIYPAILAHVTGTVHITKYYQSGDGYGRYLSPTSSYHAIYISQELTPDIPNAVDTWFWYVYMAANSWTFPGSVSNGSSCEAAGRVQLWYYKNTTTKIVNSNLRVDLYGVTVS